MSEYMSYAYRGVTLENSRFEGIPEREPMVVFPGTGYYRGAELPGRSICMGQSGLMTHVLILGSSNAGKTNVITQFASQLTSRSDTLNIFFDTKGDYRAHRRICRPGDIVLTDGPGCPAWNVFDEITSAGRNDRAVSQMAREIAQALFQDQKNAQNPFFYMAAADIFSAVLRCFVHMAEEDPAGWADHLNNADLKSFVLADPEGMHRLFEHCGHALPDVQGIASTYFGQRGSEMSLGVLAEMRIMINRYFQGLFQLRPSPQHPSFSVINWVRQQTRGSLFVEYDIQRGAVLSPVYSLLFDLAMQEALSPEHSRTRSSNVFFFLDELKLLPKVTHLEDVLNFGRSNRAAIIAGMQSVNQLADTYGRERCSVILGGFGTLIAMRQNDPESRRFVSNACGQNQVVERTMDSQYLPREERRTGNIVEDWHIQQLTQGQAIIKLSTQNAPFRFKFSRDPYA